MIDNRLFYYVTTPLLCFLLACSAKHRPTNEAYRGDQWLAWSEVERNDWVDGYVTGYGLGAQNTCKSADDLFESSKPDQDASHYSPSSLPSARCRANIDGYSKGIAKGNQTVDNGAYTTVITKFYEKYPKYKNVPFIYLMSILNDSKYKTADDLYSMAEKGELRTVF
jgi:hypothetical protein